MDTGVTEIEKRMQEVPMLIVKLNLQEVDEP
jgi:hypothetical protein